MTALIDPRPMEPDWVREAEPIDLVDYKITRFVWNKEARKYDRPVESYSSNTRGLLEAVASMLSACVECEIEVDATQRTPVESLETPIHYSIKIPGFTGMFSQLRWLYSQNATEAIYEEEDTTDNDELLAGVEWLCNECKAFTINIGDYDPTP